MTAIAFPEKYAKDIEKSMAPYDFVKVVGGHLELGRPIAYDEMIDIISLLEAVTGSDSLADAALQTVVRAQEEMLLGKTEDELFLWVEQFSCKRAYLPLAIPDLREREAEFLFELQEHLGELFALRLRRSVMKFARSYLALTVTRNPRILEVVLRLIGLFSIVELAPDLIRRLEDSEWSEINLRAGAANNFAIRVLSDITDERTLTYLQQQLSDPEVAAACYEGILVVKPQDREGLFLTATMGAAQARDDGPLRAVCSTYLKTSPAEILVPIHELLQSLIEVNTETSDRITINLIAAAIELPGIVTIEHQPAWDFIEPERPVGHDTLRLSAVVPNTVDFMDFIVPTRLSPVIRGLVPPDEPEPHMTMGELLKKQQVHKVLKRKVKKRKVLKRAA